MVIEYLFVSLFLPVLLTFLVDFSLRLLQFRQDDVSKLIIVLHFLVKQLRSCFDSRQ